MSVSASLLKLYKQSIGDFNFENNPLDEYYSVFLTLAYADLSTDDISIQNLESELGQSLICLYAEALMNKTDVAKDPTITLLKNKLSLMTKGDAVDV